MTKCKKITSKYKKNFISGKNCAEQNTLPKNISADFSAKTIMYIHTIYVIQGGELDIPTEILIKLAKYHDVSVDYIRGNTYEKRSYKNPLQLSSGFGFAIFVFMPSNKFIKTYRKLQPLPKV